MFDFLNGFFVFEDFLFYLIAWLEHSLKGGHGAFINQTHVTLGIKGMLGKSLHFKLREVSKYP